MENPTDQLIDAARALLKAHGYFTDLLWSTDDIRLICEQHGWPLLTRPECLAVFALVRARFDGTQGLSWPLLEEAVRDYLATRGQDCRQTEPEAA